MCGIAGFYSHSNVLQEDLVKAVSVINHRGPDANGTRVFKNGMVGLGHARLSIIDLSDAGHQPMHNEDGTIWIVFNGEIYNYKYLRKQLVDKGHIFSSRTDSEVLIHGYEEWGVELLPKLNGMFAFAIWDGKRGQMFLARDRFGIKPLHYFYNGSDFIFGSELKSILSFSQFKKEINSSALIDYFNYSQVPAPKTIWKNTYKLEPASYLIIKEGNIIKQKYWNIQSGKISTSLDYASEMVWELLNESVKRNLESDVPVGLFLSSGYDSSSLLALMSEYSEDINTYSIGFPGSKKTEHIESREIANLYGSSHYEQLMDENFMQIINSLFDYYDEPFSITSMVSYYYVSKLASERNKVVFAGDGGDEVLGGYKWYNAIDKSFHDRSIFERLRHLSKENKKAFYHQHYYRHMGIGMDWVKTILSPELIKIYPDNAFWPYDLELDAYDLSPVKVFQLLDFKTFIPDSNLKRADLSSMANSLEVRVPFLDNDLVDFAMSLDESVYFNPKVKKQLLHSNLTSRLPANILNLPKKGFGNPLDGFYSNKANTIKLLEENLLVEAEIVRPDINYRSLDKKQLWLVFALDCWVRKWLN